VELSWLMKLRIAAAAAAGVILIGFLAWPLVAPPGPFGAVSVVTGDMNFGGAITLAGLAFLAGLLAYFLSWPYGREIGILAVPAGLAIWAVRSGNMASLIQSRATLAGQQQQQIIATVARRQDLFAALKWEPLFWLAIIAVGFAGVLVGSRIRSKHGPDEAEKKANSKANIYLNAAVALVGSGLIAQFCIGILAQDVRIFDDKLGSVVAQPTVGQIVFAVFVSFGLAAFVVKRFLDAGYIWPIIAGAFVTVFAITTYVKQDMLQHLVQHCPAAFFPNVVISILPVQMAAFGALGSIAGYWMAVRCNYSRKHG